MYFGLYLNASQRPRYDALPFEAPCAGPSLLGILRALFRRIFP